MIKKYIATVNNTKYEVLIEEVPAGTVVKTESAAPAPVAAPAPAAAPAASAAPADGTKVTSPLPGTVLKVNVSAGATVKKGDVLCVLEAMKMENDIPAPVDGVIKSVNVNNGATVNANDLLFVIG